ncbi:MAG: hypothetical protein AVDCRST_MAG64-2239, partial [uncultured Phycisphaerae bacterium]
TSRPTRYCPTGWPRARSRTTSLGRSRGGP